MAFRNLLLKLDRRDYIQLPPRAWKAYNHRRFRRIPDVLHLTDSVDSDLQDILPVHVVDARDNSYTDELFTYFLHHYHDLSFTTTVGENIKYLVFDRRQRPLACLLFGAPAWSIKPRDQFIGWDRKPRQYNLNFITKTPDFSSCHELR